MCGFGAVWACVEEGALLHLSGHWITWLCVAWRVVQQAWDFYKPNLMSEYPSVDGQLSQSCYLRAVDDTYNKTVQHMAKFYGAGADAGVEDLFKYMVFHSPYNKLVRQSFGRLLWNDFRRRVAVGLPLSPLMEPLMECVRRGGGVVWCGVEWCGVEWSGVVWCGVFRARLASSRAVCGTWVMQVCVVDGRGVTDGQEPGEGVGGHHG